MLSSHFALMGHRASHNEAHEAETAKLTVTKCQCSLLRKMWSGLWLCVSQSTEYTFTILSGSLMMVLLV